MMVSRESGSVGGERAWSSEQRERVEGFLALHGDDVAAFYQWWRGQKFLNEDEFTFEQSAAYFFGRRYFGGNNDQGLKFFHEIGEAVRDLQEQSIDVPLLTGGAALEKVDRQLGCTTQYRQLGKPPA